MYLKDPEKVFKFMHIVFTVNLQLQIYCVYADNAGLLHHFVYCYFL